GFGDERHDRPAPGGKRAVDGPSRLGRARERNPRDSRIGSEGRPDRLAVSREQMQDISWYAGRQQMAYRRGGDERRLLGGFGDYRIAGGERRGDLPGEDRQWEIPWRDASEDAAAVKSDLVPLARRAGQGLRCREFGAGACRVVAQEIDGFAHFRQ